jgi:hypothetical protein
VTLIHGGDAPNLVGQRLSVLSNRTDDEIAAELGLSAEQMAEFRAEWDREAQQRRRAAERQSETEDWAIRRATSRLEARGIVSRRPADEHPSVRAEPTRSSGPPG